MQYDYDELIYSMLPSITFYETLHKDTNENACSDPSLLPFAYRYSNDTD